jgi:hypothetical protein
MKKSIFVQISSYHDYELEKTLRNALLKSSGETHIVFGIHSIFFNNNDWLEPVKKFSNVKLIESKAPENLGVGIGRHVAHQLYSGEDYYFQIDAHSRFDQNWDTFLINEIENHKNNGFQKPIITNYPKPYWYEGDIEVTRNVQEPVLQFYWKSKENFYKYRQPGQDTIVNPVGNIHSISISGGCMFSEGEFLKPNSLIFFDGEEVFNAARAYTSGYDLFVPAKPFMYHLYSNKNSTGKNRRRFITEDWVEETYALEAISKEELVSVLSNEGLVGEYRLGNKRSLLEYGEYCGLNFKTGEIIKNYEQP